MAAQMTTQTTPSATVSTVSNSPTSTTTAAQTAVAQGKNLLQISILFKNSILAHPFTND